MKSLPVAATTAGEERSSIFYHFAAWHLLAVVTTCLQDWQPETTWLKWAWPPWRSCQVAHYYSLINSHRCRHLLSAGGISTQCLRGQIDRVSDRLHTSYSVHITWCSNRLSIHIAREITSESPQSAISHACKLCQCAVLVCFKIHQKCLNFKSRSATVPWSKENCKKTITREIT